MSVAESMRASCHDWSTIKRKLSKSVDALWADIVLERGWVTFSANFRGKGASPTNEFWH